jgi:phosphopantetheine adenylyltransferase
VVVEGVKLAQSSDEVAQPEFENKIRELENKINELQELIQRKLNQRNDIEGCGGRDLNPRTGRIIYLELPDQN